MKLTNFVRHLLLPVPQVSLPVVRRFVARVEERALGTTVLKGVKPEQQLVKVVNDALIDLMGGKASGLVEGGPGRPQVLLHTAHILTCSVRCTDED